MLFGRQRPASDRRPAGSQRQRAPRVARRRRGGRGQRRGEQRPGGDLSPPALESPLDAQLLPTPRDREWHTRGALSTRASLASQRRSDVVLLCLRAARTHPAEWRQPLCRRRGEQQRAQAALGRVLARPVDAVWRVHSERRPVLRLVCLAGRVWCARPVSQCRTQVDACLVVLVSWSRQLDVRGHGGRRAERARLPGGHECRDRLRQRAQRLCVLVGLHVRVRRDGEPRQRKRQDKRHSRQRQQTALLAAKRPVHSGGVRRPARSTRQ